MTTAAAKAAREFKKHVDAEIEALLDAAAAAKPHKPRIGQPSKAVGPHIKIYLRALTNGHSIEASCAAAGFTSTSVQTWRKKGARDIEEGNEKTIYAVFLRSHERALALGLLRKEQELYAAEKRTDDTRSMRNVLGTRFRKSWADPNKPQAVIRIDPSALKKDDGENGDLL